MLKVLGLILFLLPQITLSNVKLHMDLIEVKKGKETFESYRLEDLPYNETKEFAPGLKVALKEIDRDRVELRYQIYRDIKGVKQLVATPVVITKYGVPAQITSKNEKGDKIELAVLPVKTKTPQQ